MRYFKIMPYLFLVFGALFLYEAITRMMAGEDAIPFFLFAGVAVFMFFFRRNSYKKFDNSKKE